MQKNMTAEQAFNLSMNQYPSLYADADLEKSQLKYYNHIFNVIGNGYRTVESFLETHTINKDNEHLLESFPEKYISNQPLFYAYTEIDEHRSFRVGKQGSNLPGLYTKKELKNMPEVKHTTQINKIFQHDNIFVPYPNFKKQFSLIWKDAESLDSSWFEAAKFFYMHCKEFFASDNVHLYHNAVPLETNKEAWQKLINSYESNFARLKTPDMTEEQYYKAVTDAYLTEYLGDTKVFIENRWKNEHARIHQFLDDTFIRLEELTNNKSLKMKHK